MTATAHLIHGYMGVGKTTFARRLEQELPAVRFTHDEWMAKLYGIDPPAERFADYAQRVTDVMQEVWERCLTLGTDVVLDSGFWSRAERDAVRARIEALGTEHRLYRISCDEAVAWSRIEKRNAEAGAHLYIAPNTFHVLKQRVEPLGDDEPRTEVDGQQH